MAKTGRNDPCPCGSGQKYKRCCLPRDAAAERAAAERTAAIAREDESSVTDAAIGADDDGLDNASNRVIDLITAGQLDEAEQAAHDLLARYPEVHDGLERLAMVCAARGDCPRAAEYYRKAGDFVHAHADRYGPNMESYFWKRVAEFEAPQE